MNRIRAWLFGTLSHPIDGRPALGRRLARLGYLTGSEFARNLCFQRAAALSFASIISLIPLAVLFFSFAGMLGGGEEIIKYVRDKVFPQVAPDFQGQLSEWLDTYISKEAFSGGAAGIVNVAAVLGLLLAALGLMSTAERNFNRIWGVAARRSYLQRLSAFWIILTISPFLIALSMGIGDLLVPKGGLVERLTQESWIIRSIYSLLVPLVVGFLGFSTVYVFLPNTRVRLRSAALGGLIAAVLWEVSKRSFFLYIARASTVTSFYPKLAALPLFLVWIYLNWVILLIGAELAFVHQNQERLAQPQPASAGRRYSRLFLGLTLLGRIRQAFEAGEPSAPVEEIAGELGASPADLEDVARMLEDRGYLVEDARNAGRFVLAQPPERVTLKQVARELAAADFPLEVDTPLESPARARLAGEPVEALLGRAWDGFLGSFDQRTLSGEGKGPAAG